MQDALKPVAGPLKCSRWSAESWHYELYEQVVCKVAWMAHRCLSGLLLVAIVTAADLAADNQYAWWLRYRRSHNCSVAAT